MTALLEVEPPSRPMTPRTTCPGSNVAGTNLGIAYVVLKSASSSGVFASGGPALSPRRALRPVVMYSRSAPTSARSPMPSASCIPKSTAPCAA